jgi:hypothetical protein
MIRHVMSQAQNFENPIKPTTKNTKPTRLVKKNYKTGFPNLASHGCPDSKFTSHQALWRFMNDRGGISHTDYFEWV